MKITAKVKIALDETRMLVLGAQILIGFQFRGVFQNLYDRLPPTDRYLNGAALLLMIVTLGLLLFPGSYHRIVEDGNASGHFHRVTSSIAFLALAPLTASLAIDVGIAGERMWGWTGGFATGALIGAIALFFWYGLGMLRMRSIGKAERAMTRRQKEEVEQTKLHERIDQMLTEARIVLPGAQALLGFQLAIVVTEGFEKLSPALKSTHGAALVFVALSIILLMAPAAYHRIVYAGEDSEAFHRTGSRFVAWSTVPLAAGLAADVFVVWTKIVPSLLVSGVVGLLVLLLLLGFWHGLPWLTRLRQGYASRASMLGSMSKSRTAI